jgi:hypothetical protein
MGVPVRTSVGAPRSFPAPLVEWPTVYPWGIYNLDLDEATFRRKYRHGLWSKKPKVLAELSEFQAGYDQDLVLLCFEPAETFCHRTVLAGWLEEQLGETISELS